MHPILLPYHLDEHLPELEVPLRPAQILERELPGGTADVWARMAELYNPLADAVAELTTSGETPVVQSGDCTASLGIVAGLQRAGLEPSVVWFDAHGDVQTLETTASGYLGGMPLRMLAGYRPELIGTALGLEPIPEERLVLVDARDLDPPEREYLDNAQIHHVEVAEIGADDIPDGPVYLHIDLDVITPDDLPGQLFPAPGRAERRRCRGGRRTGRRHRPGGGRRAGVHVGCEGHRSREQGAEGCRRPALSGALCNPSRLATDRQTNQFANLPARTVAALAIHGVAR